MDTLKPSDLSLYAFLLTFVICLITISAILTMVVSIGNAYGQIENKIEKLPVLLDIGNRLDLCI